MSKKFCPLGFFSFYVNKSQAQAGAAHHCVEEDCALWNEDYEECSLKVGLDAITSLAEQFATGQRPERPHRHLEIDAPKHSIFDKLRKKSEGQKLPVVDSAPITPTSVPVVTPAVLPTPITKTNPTNGDDLLKPPDVPLDALPVISSQEV